MGLQKVEEQSKKILFENEAKPKTPISLSQAVQNNNRS
jgi:hypothetical protein